MKARWLNLFVLLTLMLASAATFAGDSLLIDTAPVIEEFVDERCDGSISVKVIPEGVVATITLLEAYIEPLEATNVRFAIASTPENNLLLYTDPVAVSPGLQFVTSPPINFRMIPEETYEIAAMVQGCANFPWDTVPSTENGLTTTSRNGNPDNYDAPTNFGESNGVDPRFLIYGTVTTFAIPTLNIWGLFLLGAFLLAAVMIMRRRLHS